jgi:pectinesterase
MKNAATCGLWLLAIALLGRPAGAAPPEAGAVVAADGSGRFKSIQEAINAAPQTSSATEPWTIHVRPGNYHEIVYVQREKHFVRLVGDDPLATTISYGLYASLPGQDGKPIGTFHTPTVWIDADDFVMENLTVANSAGAVGQALALRVDGDRVSFLRCRFLGWQDTILANRGRQYFGRCTVQGAVDFIFGGATSFFDRCEIDCVGNGYITAASTPAGQPFGLVFSRCTISGLGGVQTYLGRPWRPYADVVFLNTQMSAVVRPAGWHNWNQPEREKTSRFVEFGSYGPGANTPARAAWSKTLPAPEATEVGPESVLSGTDHWKPPVAE